MKYSTCQSCGNAIDPKNFIRAKNTCHACLKLDKWKQQLAAEVPNVEVIMLFNGHWKAYLLTRDNAMRDLIASGHIRQELFDNREDVVDDILRKAIQWNVRKHYTPDPKYRFEGLTRLFYFRMDLDTTDITTVLTRATSDTFLPTLRMKSPHWMLWLPKVDPQNPQLRDTEIFATITTYENREPSTDIQLVPQTNFPFYPAQLTFSTIGRYWVDLKVGGKGSYKLDIDVDRRALEE